MLGSDHISSWTSACSVLQLYKVSQKSNKQMCMKEYGCCRKYKRGDNSTNTLTKRGHVPCRWVSLHAHLQVVYYNCVKFHKNSISSLVGVSPTRYMPPFRQRISWIISPFIFSTATIFLHAHLFGGYIGITVSVRPSVCPSLCPSVHVPCKRNSS
jgi:hypothetical protein